MKHAIKSVVLGLSLFLANGSTAYGQDYGKGWEAVGKGDYATASREWRPLAEQGDAGAQFSLCLMPDGTQADAEAFRWCRLAAEKGFATAQFNLGVKYVQGKVVTQNYKEAVKWYRLAAEQGEYSAQINLGNLHYIGLGVTEDYKEAVKWYRLAAAQGVAEAQYSLGFMYDEGKGVIQDNVYAHMWYNIAASNSFVGAVKNRDSIAKNMTAADISKAQDLARACVQKSYKDC